MISRLRGKPVARRPDGLVLDVNGVGYLVAATPGVLRCAEGAEEVVVETYLVVREDALALYGFADASERELFEHLISVSGVGPKMALAIVSGSTSAELRRAIALEDTKRFEAIPGIGRKTAQRVVLELKEKIGIAPVDEAALDPGGLATTWPPAMRWSSSATRCSTRSGRWRRSIRISRPRSAFATPCGRRHERRLDGARAWRGSGA